jgi:hypothetical protein
MKRREFVEKLGIGSALVVSGSALAAPGHAAPNGDDEHGNHHRPIRGELSNATVSFGAWPVGTVAVPVDRFAIPFAPAQQNIHQLIPYIATIKEGGSVNFIVAGFHQIVVYAPGTKPGDIDTTTNLIVIATPPPPLPVVGLINDPNNRIYRGIDPRFTLQGAPPGTPVNTQQDRVEVVQFGERGLYLVICAVNVHFAEGMFGYVRVRRHEHDND